MTPLVSILIPAYNAERSIGDTIRSALEQTWLNKEIVVVDDGSRDRTLENARRFASSNVCVTRQENQGAAAARNKAFELCQGNYIQWLDADDILAADKVARQMEVAEEVQSEGVLLSAAWGSFMHRPSKAQFISTPLWCSLSPAEWLMRKMGQNLHMQTATWLVSRMLTKTAGPWDTRLSLDDDGEYFCRVLLATSSVRFVDEAKVFYRDSGVHSLSNVDQSKKKLESQFLSIQLHVKYLLSLENSKRTRAACVRYLQSRFINFFPERPDLVEELQQLAADLGGGLEIPRLGRKYFWIQRVFGYRAAKRSRSSLRLFKWQIVRSWDKALALWENAKSAKPA